jgi:3-deoxy-D-manno-octulosonate 8-phosphate phosphatase (KDO 8-P phosphatase)
MSNLQQILTDFIDRVDVPEVWSDVDGVHTSGTGGVTLCDVVAKSDVQLEGLLEISEDNYGNQLFSRLLVPCTIDGGIDHDAHISIAAYCDEGLKPAEANFELYQFHPPDGKVIEYLRTNGIRVCFISGRNSACVADRARKLGAESYLGEKDKLPRIQELAKVPLSDIIFFGDHIQDVEAMLAIKEAGGVTIAPADAASEAIGAATYVTECDGGRGVLAEFFKVYLKLRGWWPDGSG